MSTENERFIELDCLIRGAYAELGALQIHLIEAHARGFNPAELGVNVANLGRQISGWKREREFLPRRTFEPARPIIDLKPNGGFTQKASRDFGTVRSRRAVSAKKSQPASSNP